MSRTPQKTGFAEADVLPVQPSGANASVSLALDREGALVPATAADLPRIENLMQFYNHDMSEWYPASLGSHGLYDLRPKQPYWANPNTRPYIARVAGDLAGFAVVDDEVTDSRSQFNLGYLFVARRYRGMGLGGRWVKAMLGQHPGEWEVFHYTANRPAGVFWPRAIAAAATEGLRVEEMTIDDAACKLYKFRALESGSDAA